MEPWWGEDFGFLAGVDSVLVVRRLRRGALHFRRGRRTTLRFRPDTERDWTAISTSCRCVVVEIEQVELSSFFGIFGDGGILGTGGRWAKRVRRYCWITVIITDDDLLILSSLLILLPLRKLFWVSRKASPPVAVSGETFQPKPPRWADYSQPPSLPARRFPDDPYTRASSADPGE